MNFLTNLKYSFKFKNCLLCPILTEERFRKHLERERLRTHRNSFKFSVLYIEAASSKKLPVYEKLIVFLKNRLRSTDEIGWCKNQTIGVLLLDTDEVGARIISNEIKQKMHPDNFLISIRIYPDKNPSNKTRRKGEDCRDVSINSGEKAKSENRPYLSCPSQNLSSHNRSAQNHSEMTHGVADYGFIHPEPLWKRVLDIIGATVGLILSLPLFVIFGAHIKIVSPGPVFFKQERIGFRGKPFTIWKFRTMHVCADTQCHEEYCKSLIENDAAAMQKLDQHDDRLIPFAKILRASGLDEIPQLFNVIKGEMSLVGPRPCMAYEAEDYCIWQHERFDSKPGLTGLWQVSGKNRTSFMQMMRFDARYARNQTFLRDLFIIFMTIPALFIQVMDGRTQKGKENNIKGKTNEC